MRESFCYFWYCDDLEVFVVRLKTRALCSGYNDLQCEINENKCMGLLGTKRKKAKECCPIHAELDNCLEMVQYGSFWNHDTGTSFSERFTLYNPKCDAGSERWETHVWSCVGKTSNLNNHESFVYGALMVDPKGGTLIWKNMTRAPCEMDYNSSQWNSLTGDFQN